jgi:hypothetical protein
MFKQLLAVVEVDIEELIMIKQVENLLEQVVDQELIYQIKYLQ